MARLRYNGLRTTLGASLTNSATSVTFAAALTHSNGTAVPTLAGSDYIPLVILDSSGHLSEIVWLTAYTSGATTGTIARGKEGTSGVTHAAGDVIGCAPTASDAVSTARAKRSSGDLTFNTTGWQDVSTSLDLVFPSVPVGSVVSYSPAFTVESINNPFAFDVATIVSGSPVNYFGTSGGASDNGVPGWYALGDGFKAVSGTAQYVVQSGDLDSSGNLTLRLRIRPANTTARKVYANANQPLMVSAMLIP